MGMLRNRFVSAFSIGVALLSLLSVVAATAQGDALQQASDPNGIVSIEVEDYSSKAVGGPHAWEVITSADSSGGRAVQALPNKGKTRNFAKDYVVTSPRLDFKVNFVETGKHYVWVRGAGATAADDSVHVGFNGAASASSDLLTGFKRSLTWSQHTTGGAVATLDVNRTGVHMLNIWMREDGVVLDKLVLTTNPRYVPQGLGPIQIPPTSADGAPVIKLLGENPLTLEAGQNYVEPGATAQDETDGDLTSAIVIDDSAVDIARAGSYEVTYAVVDSTRNQAKVKRTVNVVDAQAALPAGWESLDVGDVELAGYATSSGRMFTVQGAGKEIWNQSDGFRFVYRELRGDGEITARVVSIDPVNPRTKAGVMIRESLAADSSHSMMNITPNNGAWNTRRLITGGRSSSRGHSFAPAPYWVKMVRIGDSFKAYESLDGGNWTLVDTQTISMAAAVYIGLAVTSNDPNAVATATFDNVVVKNRVDTVEPEPEPEPTPNSQPRENLVDKAIGFGGNTTGGLGGESCRVTNLNDSGAGSLRACAESEGPKWITFNVSGTIPLESAISVKSNKTIDGRGEHVVLAVYGLELFDVENIIVHNIEITNTASPKNTERNKNIKDAISINSLTDAKDTKNIWIDHVTFYKIDDGMVDIVSSGSHQNTPKNITISWSHLKDVDTSKVDRAMLFGNTYSENGAPDRNITVTLHHNHFDKLNSRLPHLIWGQVHAFNNYWNEPASSGAYITYNGQFYSENNIFEKKDGKQPTVLIEVGPNPNIPGDPGADSVKSVGDWLLNGARVNERNPHSIFNPRSSYSYSAETANDSLRESVANHAGWQNVPAP